MARRTLDEIQKELLKKKAETESLNALDVLTTEELESATINSTSKVSIWRLWIFIQAFAIWVHEGIFEVHKEEIEALIALNKVHNALWYRGKALAFQLGFDLGESDVYDNSDSTSDEVEASKIIKQASVEEIAGRLKIKAAKYSGVISITGEQELGELTEEELIAFTEYMELIKDAGTRLNVISRPPDQFKGDFDIYFDPLVLNAAGQRLDGTNNTPVPNAIQEFLYNLEFNGEFILTKLVDYLQTVEGVEMPVPEEVSAKFGANDYAVIDETYIADSGYMALDLDETNFNFIPREL